MARIPILLAVMFSCSVRCSFRNHQPNPASSFLQRVSPFPSAGQRLIGRFPGSSDEFDFSYLLGQDTIESESFSNPQSPAPADPLAQTCGLAPQVCQESRYRTIDGSCNNLQHPVWGAAHTPYGKLLPPKYADGISALPVSSTGLQLPEERQLSLQLFPESYLVDPVWNLNAMQWGQIVTHDMSLTAGNPQSPKKSADTRASNDNSDRNSKENENELQCCTNGQLTQAAYSNPACAPINISPQDPVMGSAGVRCMNFVRTQTTLDRRCTSPREPARPISTVTAFMDLSIIYGSTPTQAAPVRSFAGGRLLTVVRGGQEWPPQDPNVTMTCNMAQSPDEPCYLGGDVRLNQNPQLTVLHILILREHNRIADSLIRLNPHWDDERTFQEARRINIAINQHINYYEWLPIFLGHDNMVKNKLIYPGATGYINDYNPSVNPAILDEHATAAFRFFHTLIRGYLQLIREDRSVFGSIRISDWFNRPQLLELGNSFSQLVRGLASQNEDYADQFWTSEITQFMFKQNAQFGADLRATDIKRGRDHGLPSYVDTRRVCGLPVPRTFEEMTDYISVENVKVLQSLYRSVEDVELVVAGSLEGLVPGALCGPTYLAVMTEQFYRTRVGDRFFFENGHPSVAFTPAQLESIRQASISRLLCDNTPDVTVMQPQGFRLVGERHNNLLIPCEQLPFVDLSLWQEIPGHSPHYR